LRPECSKNIFQQSSIAFLTAEFFISNSITLIKLVKLIKKQLSISDKHHHKNFVRLIKAYGILVNRYHINEHLVIIGRVKSLKEEKLLKQIISESKLENRVHLLDHIDQSELPNIYRKASVYVFPSKFETFGFTPLEAMACGAPVACAQCSAMPEICGSNVLYFDPDNEEDIALKVIKP